MKAAFILTLGVAMRTSEARAKAKPPPLAAPSTRAMIGWGQRRMAMTISLIRRWLIRPAPGPRGSLARGSFRSRPAQKLAPAPRSTTARISWRQ